MTLSSGQRFTVGFDLDMTLIDPRHGMLAAMNALAADTGLPLDGEHFANNLGPPIAQVFREFGVPEERVPELVASFRATYPEIVVPATVAMPGAGEALASVRALGGETVVVTAKNTPHARLHVTTFGWQVDHVIGNLWSAEKAVALRAHRASIYVGDHVSDVVGALAAGAVPVGVTTGPCDARALTEAGAEVVLATLADFPAWLAARRARNA